MGSQVLSQTERNILESLQDFLTPQRRERFEEILARRTRLLTLVLENVYQPLNQSAVLRTAEAMGLQDVHIVESANPFKIDHEITMGSDRWLTIHRHCDDGNAIRDCLETLKSDGFRILAASPHPPATPLPEIAVGQKTALVIGHETDGVSEVALEYADERVAVPMWGFVESLNLSVAAAVCLFHLRSKLDAFDLDWELSDDEADVLRLDWTRKSIPNVAAIERRFHEARGR